ncbi:MAG TPA: calcium-binding protein, partial [Vicinamibacterales bacterium]|nr:calcium-binding protein [Vicinamibacterales bacterium]
MGSKKKSGGSHGRDNHHDRDDHHYHGGHKGVNLKGTKSDDVLTGTARNDRISGGKGDDELFGLAGNDLLLGGKGDDSLLGGAGNDVLYGDGPGQDKFWFWGKCLWWIPQSDDDDVLDGGAGNDTVFAGRGDDVLLYSMAGNLGTGFANIGTHDIYDGGSGFDTLLLELTYGEYLLGSVQADIDAFKAFLEDKANPRSDHGKVFQFKSFDLDARNFEALEVRLVNNVPTANDDANATDEDSSLVIP